jgi:hypothetical protein
MSSTAGLTARFSLEPRQADGQWVNVEYIRIISATDKFNAPHRPVEPEDKVRFARQYEAWKKGISETPKSGQSLKAWPGITPAEVNVLAQAGIHTVEALAAASDEQVGEDGPYVALRDSARRFIDVAGNITAITRMEAEKRALEARVAELEERLTNPDAEPAKRGPGRPRKDAAKE